MSDSSGNPTKILLKQQGATPQDERLAGGTIKPGHLIKANTSDRVVVHDTAGGAAEKLVAIEDALQGNTIDDSYSSGDRVFFVSLQPGDEAYMFVSAGENISVGDQMSSNGDGCLREVQGSDKALFVALEAVDASDSNVDGQDDERIKVRAL